jgi:hypothetical protein
MPSNNHRNCLLYLRLGDAIEQIKIKIDWKMWGSLLLMISLLLMWVLKFIISFLAKMLGVHANF